MEMRIDLIPKKPVTRNADLEGYTILQKLLLPVLKIFAISHMILVHVLVTCHVGIIALMIMLADSLFMADVKAT
jgi:hypothetical protein